MANDFFYKKVEAYSKAKFFTIQAYRLLKSFPSNEQYALCDQIRRAAVSVPSNIAEGMGRTAIKERIRFLEIAYGSLAEATCQFDIAKDLGYISHEEYQEIENTANETARIMSGLRKSLLEKTKQSTDTNKA